MRYKRELSVAIVYTLVLVALAVFAPRFYQGDKYINLLVASAPKLIAAVGMTMVILTRNIDISIGSQLSICGVVAGLTAKSGAPLPLVALAAISAGLTMGAINGIFVALLRLPSIVVTLAMMVVLRESLRWWRQGESVKDLPDNFQWFGMDQTAGQWTLIAIALLVFVAFAWFLRYLKAGRAVYATGSDAEAAWLVGIRAHWVVFGVFTLMGGLTGLAALLNAVRLPQVDTLAGAGLELQVIAAVVVGGVAISGGRGLLFGVLWGVALLGVIGSALVFLGAEAYWEKAFQGGIILLAVASDAFDLQRKRHGQ